VKTLVTAVDAATAEGPSARSAGGGAANNVRRQAAQQTHTPVNSSQSTARPEAPAARKVSETAARKAAYAASQKAGEKVTQAREVRQGMRRGTRRFGEAIWNPFVRLSGVLWLEVTGVFFGIFALFALAAVWRMRADWHGSEDGRRSLLGAVAMLVVFGYFCISSFVRARRRERGK
jgi:hypothetical protein